MCEWLKYRSTTDCFQYCQDLSDSIYWNRAIVVVKTVSAITSSTEEQWAGIRFLLKKAIKEIHSEMVDVYRTVTIDLTNVGNLCKLFKGKKDFKRAMRQRSIRSWRNFQKPGVSSWSNAGTNTSTWMALFLKSNEYEILSFQIHILINCVLIIVFAIVCVTYW